MPSRWLRSIVVAAFLFVPASASAQQMPDPKKISGVPLPMSDMSVGTVTVRVIRGQLTNPLPDQSVELTGAGAPRTAPTDSAGRAQFTGLTPGTRIKASVTVAGERIESQEFAVPISGGVRLMLVATDAETEKKAAEDRQLAQSPAVQGMVVLGDQTKFVIEVGDEGLNVFNILQIVNTARTPVQPTTPVVFDLPDGASGAGIMEGSAPNAVVAGKQVAVKGPFAPGNTLVQFAYSLALKDERLTIQQRLPAQLLQLSVIAQKASPEMRLSSPQLSGQREMSAEGQAYIVAQGSAVRAGDAISLTLSGLPHHATWPRNVALALAGAILAVGLWAARRRAPVKDGAEASRLQARRDRLFTELTALEQQKQTGAIDERHYDARRQDLVSALEAVYRQLDDRQVA